MTRQHASIFITAQSGMGKSYLATYLIKNLSTKRKYVIDYAGEYIIPGFALFNVTPETYKHIKTVTDKKNNIIFRFELMSKENIEKIANYISSIAIKKKNTLIVFEECHEYIHKTKPAAYIQEIATGGRKHGVSSLFISQRPSLLNSTIRSQSNIKISGKMTDMRDYEAIRSLFTHYWLIPRLKPRVFLYHGVDGKEFLFTTDRLKVTHQG